MVYCFEKNTIFTLNSTLSLKKKKTNKQKTEVSVFAIQSLWQTQNLKRLLLAIIKRPVFNWIAKEL